jgi:uncharacterized protein (TIGR03382 family)
VHVVNRGSTTATGVALDANADPSLRLTSTALDCTGGLPCTLGDLAPGAVKTVVASYSFASSVPRRATVEFRISGGSPAPAARDASTTIVASRASGCSSAGSGPGGILALLAVAGWFGRRRATRNNIEVKLVATSG